MVYQTDFKPGAMVTFLGGIPSDEEMATEHRLKQDFQGEENSQDIIINFADSKDNALLFNHFHQMDLINILLK